MPRTITLPDNPTPEQTKGFLQDLIQLIGFGPDVYSFTVGLNRTEWCGPPLHACENDARSMAELFGDNEDRIYFRHTDADLWASMDVQMARPEKILPVSFSCHGMRTRDKLGDEDDGQDEAVCLTNRAVSDDELWAKFCQYPSGKVVPVFFDMCHSGTALRSLVMDGGDEVRSVVKQATEIADTTRVPSRNPTLAAMEPKADLIMFSACQDNQTALDGVNNGAFTEALLRTVVEDKPKSWKLLAVGVRKRCPPTQSPQLRAYGPNQDTILDEKPFFVR